LAGLLEYSVPISDVYKNINLLSMYIAGYHLILYLI